MACHLLGLGLVMDAALQNQGASLDDTVLSKFAVVIPESIKFKQSKQALQARRVPQIIRAEQTSYASNNNKKIIIKLPNNALYDTRHGYLTFDCVISATGGDYRALAYGAWSAFDRLLIKFGSTDVEDIRDYNRITAINWELEVIPSVNSAFSSDDVIGGMGIATFLDRKALGTQTVRYAIPLWSGILNGELLPFQSVRNGMEINLFIADPSTCVETDGTNPIITISNVELNIERMDLDAKYLNFISSYIRSNGLQFGFHTFERYTSALTTGTQQNLIIQNRNSSVSGLFSIFVDSTTINSTTTNDKFINWTPRNLIQYNTLINGATFPDEPYTCEVNGAWQTYQIYLRYLAKWQLDGMISIAPPIPFRYFKVDRFMFIVDLEPYPEETGLINPFTTLGNNASLYLKLVFSSAVAAGLQCDTWVKYFKQVGIFTDGTTRVIQ